MQSLLWAQKKKVFLCIWPQLCHYLVNSKRTKERFQYHDTLWFFQQYCINLHQNYPIPHQIQTQNFSGILNLMWTWVLFLGAWFTVSVHVYPSSIPHSTSTHSIVTLYIILQMYIVHVKSLRISILSNQRKHFLNWMEIDFLDSHVVLNFLTVEFN